MSNLFDITGKVVVITGGYGILGRNIAHYLVEQGAKVVVLGRGEEQGKELEAELKKKGEALFLVSDVMNKEILEQNRDEIVARYGTIDILLNAAGGNMAGATIAPDKTFLDLDLDAVKYEGKAYIEEKKWGVKQASIDFKDIDPYKAIETGEVPEAASEAPKKGKKKVKKEAVA